MALIGEMQYLTIGGSTYSIPTGTTVEVERNLTSGTKSATIKVDGTSYDLYAPTPNAGTVTSVRVQATSPVQSSTSTAQSSSLNTTISLANGYGDTKNPYGTKTKNYVLAGPTTGSDAAPTFRALVAADIPDLSGTYLTSYTETDPVYSASAASGITSSDISNWNSKTSNTGTITSVKTTAGAHTTINVSSGAANFNVPTKTSHLTNDSGFLTSYTETDPVYSASAAAGITATDISNWNAKADSDVNVTNTTVTAATTYYLTGSTSSSTATGGLSKHAAIKAYVTANTSTSGSARIDLGNTTATTSAGGKEGIIRLYGTSATYYVELKAGAPSANRTISFPNKAGTVALTSDIPTVSYPVTSVNNKTGAVSLSASDVGALPSTTAIPSKTSDLTNDSGFITSYTDEKVKTTNASYDGSEYSMVVGSINATTETKKIIQGFTITPTSSNNIYLWLGTTDGKKGNLCLGSSSYYIYLSPATLTTQRTITLPDKTGTVALTSDIPTVSYPVTSVNNKTGAVSLSASDVGALPSTTTIPSKTSDLTNDSGFLTSYTETDPVFSASAASGITATDISNWNAKVSDTGKWNDVSLAIQQVTNSGDGTYVPLFNSLDAASVSLTPVKKTPTANVIAKYDANSYLYSTTPSANDNSTKVATTAYVDAAIPTVPTNISAFTNDSGYAVINNTTVTLTTAGWSSNSQSVTVTGVTTSNNVIVTAAAASESTYLSCGVKCSSQTANTLTFTCTTTPTDAIDVNVIVLTGN